MGGAAARLVWKHRHPRLTVGALVLFAKRTRSVLIAEGIETAPELETLHALGVELGQGYFLGRPS